MVPLRSLIANNALLAAFEKAGWPEWDARAQKSTLRGFCYQHSTKKNIWHQSSTCFSSHFVPIKVLRLFFGVCVCEKNQPGGFVIRLRVFSVPKNRWMTGELRLEQSCRWLLRDFRSMRSVSKAVPELRGRGDVTSWTPRISSLRWICNCQNMMLILKQFLKVDIWKVADFWYVMKGANCKAHWTYWQCILWFFVGFLRGKI